MYMREKKKKRKKRQVSWKYTPITDLNACHNDIDLKVFTVKSLTLLEIRNNSDIQLKQNSYVTGSLTHALKR